MSRMTVSITCLCLALIPTMGVAQNLCPSGTTSDKLVCMIPQLYGPTGLPVQAVSFGGAPINTHFQDVSPNALNPLNASIARESAILPLAPASSGFTFTWDSTVKTFVATTESFGPVLAERAETVGRHRISLGFSYQYFKFDKLDGVSLKSLPSVFLQQDDTGGVAGDPQRTCSVTGDSQTQCGYIRDVIRTDNKIDLKVHQFTAFIAYGLTDRIDLSVAIPIENVRMGAYSTATIVDNLDATGVHFAHTFPFRTGCGQDSPAQPCSTQAFSSVAQASGIGDVTLRMKAVGWKGERAGLALGADVRLPTGDSLDFLGSGAIGVRPFVVVSRRGRVSPHALVGFEINGSSKIAGDITTGLRERIPSAVTYTVGADAWVTKRLTIGADLSGQQVFQAHRIAVTQTPEPAACLDPSGQCDPSFDFATPKQDPSLTQTTASYNATYASIGGKFRPFANVLVTGNVLLRLNNGGLGAKMIPLVSLSYTF